MPSGTPRARDVENSTGLQPHLFSNQPAGARAGAPEGGRAPRDHLQPSSKLREAIFLYAKKPGCTLGVATGRLRQGTLLHEESGTGTLDLTGDFTMKAGGHAGHATWQDLAALGDEAFEKVGLFIIDRLDVEIHATAWHRAVGSAEI